MNVTVTTRLLDVLCQFDVWRRFVSEKHPGCNELQPLWSEAPHREGPRRRLKLILLPSRVAVLMTLKQSILCSLQLFSSIRCWVLRAFAGQLSLKRAASYHEAIVP